MVSILMSNGIPQDSSVVCKFPGQPFALGTVSPFIIVIRRQLGYTAAVSAISSSRDNRPGDRSL